MTTPNTESTEPDHVCEHGVAMDVHCCGCHSGFLFDSSSCVCLQLEEGEDYGDEEDGGCWRCHGEGGWHDCGEDSCCCGADAESINDDWVWCPECRGKG